MDKIVHYKNLVRNIVNEIVAKTQEFPNNLTIQRIVDEQSGNYMIYNNNWHHQTRYYGCFLHIEVRETGKIWVHHDGTDTIVVQQLLDLGVAKSDLVLAWRSPEFRRDTEFAEA